MGTEYLRDAVCIGFIANEGLSIIENAGLMGLPLPESICQAIDVLKRQFTKYDRETDLEKIYDFSRKEQVMNINQQYISERNSYSGQIPRYIVIHNTDNYSTDADARAHAMAQYHGNFDGYSAHVYVA